MWSGIDAERHSGHKEYRKLPKVCLLRANVLPLLDFLHRYFSRVAYPSLRIRPTYGRLSSSAVKNWATVSLPNYLGGCNNSSVTTADNNAFLKKFSPTSTSKCPHGLGLCCSLPKLAVMGDKVIEVAAPSVSAIAYTSSDTVV